MSQQKMTMVSLLEVVFTAQPILGGGTDIWESTEFGKAIPADSNIYYIDTKVELQHLVA